MEEQEQFVSKSERKRQATHLQKLGSRLCELNDSDLAQLALPDKLLDAIADYRRFPSREARRRHCPPPRKPFHTERPTRQRR